MADIFEKLVLEKSRKCGGAFCIPPNPFYQLQMVHFRSGTGKIYEVYGHPYPTTAIRRPPFKRGDVDLKKWHWFNPLPYVPDTVVWSFRNNINYSQTACLTTALTIAVNRETILKNYWTKTKNAISNAGKTAIGGSGYFTYPQAYVVPAKQKDMPDTIKMMNNLLKNGIEVARADTKFIIGGRVYPKGSFIISMVQPTSRLIYALFEPQKLVDEQSAPYDASAWQYGLMRDVEVDRIDEPGIFAVQKTRITADHIECPFVVRPSLVGERHPATVCQHSLSRRPGFWHTTASSLP